MNTKQRRANHQISIARLAAALLLSAMFAGCATTVEAPPAVVKAVESGGQLPPDITSFLGADNAAKLAPGPTGGAALVYISPNAQWANYTKILLEAVQFWASADSKVSSADQQTLSTYFYNQLQTTLAKNFTLVDTAGPGVLRLKVALMDATTATPGLRSVSVIVPQARILNAAQSLATDSYAFVGSAEAEMLVTDSLTGELLAAAVDKQAGGMGIKGAASFQWGDAENAMNYWAQKISTRFLELQGRAPAAS